MSASGFALGTAKNVQPPNTREEVVEAFAHCPDPTCPSIEQERVQAVKTTTEWTFASRRGSNGPDPIDGILSQFPENSSDRLRFLNDGAVPALDGVNRVLDSGAPDDTPCGSCGKPRELSAMERPVIPITIGGQDALLRMRALGVAFNQDKQERIVAGEKETPLEQLQRRYIADELDEDAYQRKLAVIAPPESAQPRSRAKKTVED